jgi:hypothetical protein
MQNLPRMQHIQEELSVITTTVMPSNGFVATRVEVQVTKLK